MPRSDLTGEILPDRTLGERYVLRSANWSISCGPRWHHPQMGYWLTMQHEAEERVRHAVLVLLGREADPEGWSIPEVGRDDALALEVGSTANPEFLPVPTP